MRDSTAARTAYGQAGRSHGVTGKAKSKAVFARRRTQVGDELASGPNDQNNPHLSQSGLQRRRAGRESLRSLKVFSGMLEPYRLLMPWPAALRLRGWRIQLARTTRYKWSHRCSTRAKSGESAGQGRTGKLILVLFEPRTYTGAAVWHLALSRWKRCHHPEEKQCACRGWHGSARTDAYSVLIHRAALHNDQ
ncbi:hypothetical protein TNCV_3335661 [Trichonephila clavipes]|nr:hypothetical protein TNCV_3335661 [Trichonephila clavipes]